MKYTLLELVQNLLSSVSSDEVNSINDTTESQQVALICKTVFYDIASELDLPEHFSLYELQASGDTSKPTLMYRPDTAHNLLWLKYNIRTEDDTQDNWKPMTYLPINDFMDFIHNLNQDDSNVISYVNTTNGDSLTFYARNDIAPQYYSTYDDNTIVFDSFNEALDTTLQKTKTLAFGGLSEVFTMSDTFTPPLDEQAFALYYNECKALVWAELKEVAHQSAERSAKRHRVALQKNKTAFGTQTSRFDRLPNYARGGRFQGFPISKFLRNGS